ncbi:unnamed protein product [Mesocestoides corti]|uniref:Uncharacterized protein n=1 Tax=Mesocestoides corti TaxID=53468 RepID=A0A0R3UNL0_MESCO|nr:unnamed protein product [Mesocestoides corti]
MFLVDASSYYVPPPSLEAATIVEVKDACVGAAEEAATIEQFKRALLGRYLRQPQVTTQTAEFVDRLLEQESVRVDVHSRCSACTASHDPPPAPVRMPFGARVENGLIKEDVFVRSNRGTREASANLAGIFNAPLNCGGGYPFNSAHRSYPHMV